jgi:hypothetical protein
MDFKLRADVRHDEGSGLYVSSCPGLGIVTQGRTEHEACEAIRSGVKMWLEHCCKTGILQKALADLGLVASEEGPRSSDEDVNGFDLDVPVHMINGMLRAKGDSSWPS